MKSMKLLKNSILIIAISFLLVTASVVLTFLYLQLDLLFKLIIAIVITILAIGIDIILIKNQIDKHELAFLQILQSLHSSKYDGEELAVSSIKSNVDRILHEFDQLERESHEDKKLKGKFVKSWASETLSSFSDLDKIILELSTNGDNLSVRVANEKLSFITQIKKLESYFTYVVDDSIQTHLETVPLEKVLSQSILSVSPLLKGKSIGLKRKITKYNIKTDPSILELVVSNVLKNAIEFSSVKSSISINCVKNNNHLFLIIEDSGIGIEQSELPLVFNKGYIGSNQHKHANGMGLYIAKNLLNGMESDIVVQSTVNKGTVVTISLKMA